MVSQSDHDSDRISQLPDHVLVHVLSLLTLTQAGRTCLVSHRWRHLWKFTTLLNFYPPESLPPSSYGSWVNQVMSLHESSCVDIVKIEYDLDEFRSNIDKLIMNFIEPGRVKRLELNLRGDRNNFKSPVLEEYYGCFRSLSNLSNTECLISLSLEGVDVNGELLENFLLNSPNLNKLSVSRSDRLVDLKVAGPSLMLKHLEVSHCRSLKSIELCAPELITLNHTGKRVMFIIGENPKLSEIIFRGRYEDHLFNALRPFSSLLPQLKTFKIALIVKKLETARAVPKLMRNLEHLILDFKVGKWSDGLIDLTSRLLAVAPNLKKITFNLSSMFVATTKYDRPIEPQPCQGLKEVEIFGFAGGCPEYELANYLLKVALNLEKMVIDPFYRLYNSKTPEMLQAPKADKKGMHAYDLNKFLPPGATLLVL